MMREVIEPARSKEYRSARLVHSRKWSAKSKFSKLPNYEVDMSELLAGLIIFVVVTMVVVYILYFFYLYRYMRLLKTKDNVLWQSYRSSAALFETQIYTAFRIMRAKQSSSTSHHSLELVAIGKRAKIFMYCGMTLLLISILLLLTFDSMIA